MIIRVSFEVHGKVQKVFFRKYTEIEAHKLKLRGFCENTPIGTVKGELEGEKDAINKMKLWLSTVGSPKSKITKCDFTFEAEVNAYKYSSFEIRKLIYCVSNFPTTS